MATTIQAGFAQLAQNLEVTALQSTTMSTRQQSVRQAVENGFTVLESFLAGSYARSTMIGPLSSSDIDIMVIIDPSYYNQYTPATLLEQLRIVLRRTYPNTPEISRNGQAVTINFTDFTVDVVPAFYRQGGGYLIPDSSTGSWISTDPTVHATVLTAANRWHAGDLIPVIKMIKGWNKKIGNAFVGFYLELSVSSILDNITISDYPSAMRYIFDKGREKIKTKRVDPAGFDNQVQGLSNVDNVNDAVSCFEAAYLLAVKAEQLALLGDVRAATNEWRRIFGDYFPAYG